MFFLLLPIQGKTVWRVNENGQVDNGWPKQVSVIFTGFNRVVDAIYRKADGTAVVFSGKTFETLSPSAGLFTITIKILINWRV